MRRTIVAGNWKLHGTQASIKALVSELSTVADHYPSIEMIVCAPYVYLPLTASLITNKAMSLGAQDVSEHEQGAFTGEVSAAMLQDVGCRYVIVGHSERRTLFGERDEDTALKYASAQRAGLTPILCVGESLAEREQGITETVVARQLEAVIQHNGVQSLANAVIAYEPVWAIGTGKTASPEQAQQVHAFIRDYIAQQDSTLASKVSILYGGSVKGSNAAELFAMVDIDGGLIGGASLKADEFLAICQAGQQSTTQ